MKPFFRFSLRTAFLVVSGVCIYLACAVNPILRERQAVDFLTTHEAKIGWGTQQGYWLGVFDRSVPRSVHVGPLVEDFTWIDNLPTLHSLSMINGSLSEVDLRRISRLGELSELELSYSSLTDRGFAELASLTRLRKLSLLHVPLTPGMIRTLQGLPGLQELALAPEPAVDVRMILHLYQSLPACSIDWRGGSGPSVRIPQFKSMIPANAARLLETTTDPETQLRAAFNAVWRENPTATIYWDAEHGAALVTNAPRLSLDMAKQVRLASRIRVLHLSASPDASGGAPAMLEIAEGALHELTAFEKTARSPGGISVWRDGAPLSPRIRGKQITRNW